MTRTLSTIKNGIVIILATIGVFLLCGDCEDISKFLLSKIAAIVIFAACAAINKIFSKLERRGRSISNMANQ